MCVCVFVACCICGFPFQKMPSKKPNRHFTQQLGILLGFFFEMPRYNGHLAKSRVGNWKSYYFMHVWKNCKKLRLKISGFSTTKNSYVLVFC